MVGGTVTEVIIQPDAVFLNVRDDTYPKDPRCGIYVERNAMSEVIIPGNKIWWQGKLAYWTSLNFTDVPIPRLSGSGVNHPEGSNVLDHSTIVEIV